MQQARPRARHGAPRRSSGRVAKLAGKVGCLAKGRGEYRPLASPLVFAAAELSRLRRLSEVCHAGRETKRARPQSNGRARLTALPHSQEAAPGFDPVAPRTVAPCIAYCKAGASGVRYRRLAAILSGGISRMKRLTAVLLALASLVRRQPRTGQGLSAVAFSVADQLATAQLPHHRPRPLREIRMGGAVPRARLHGFSGFSQGAAGLTTYDTTAAYPIKEFAFAPAAFASQATGETRPQCRGSSSRLSQDALPTWRPATTPVRSSTRWSARSRARPESRGRGCRDSGQCDILLSSSAATSCRVLTSPGRCRQTLLAWATGTKPDSAVDFSHSTLLSKRL